jgi:hypothetical protein
MQHLEVLDSYFTGVKLSYYKYDGDFPAEFMKLGLLLSKLLGQQIYYSVIVDILILRRIYYLG